MPELVLDLLVVHTRLEHSPADSRYAGCILALDSLVDCILARDILGGCSLAEGILIVDSLEGHYLDYLLKSQDYWDP